MKKGRHCSKEYNECNAVILWEMFHSRKGVIALFRLFRL